jgi:hypothetical protein
LLWRRLKLANDSKSLFHLTIESLVRMKAAKAASSFFLPAMNERGFQTYQEVR